MRTIVKFCFALATMLSLTSLNAHAVIDPGASSVMLRTSCTDAGGSLMDDCFDDPTALMGWIKTTRNPSEGDSLVVEIGPGNYERIQWLCGPNEGHVSFRGAGRGRTVFENNVILSNAMTFQNCEDLTFDSMTIKAHFISVVWAGHGNATWTDVELIGGYSTWYETPENQLGSGAVCTSGPNNEHKFFSSSLILKDPYFQSFMYLNHCGITWFYGSELIVDARNATANGTLTGIVSEGAGHEVHLYGSNIRLFLGANSSNVDELVTFEGSDGAQIHIHGTGIDTISERDTPITVLKSNPGGHIHADASAYVIRTGAGGSITRIGNNGGHVHAPYAWTHVPDTDGNPATIDTNYFSVNGADQTVVTMGTSDGHPHNAVYSASCPSSARWYDLVDKVCRDH